MVYADFLETIRHSLQKRLGDEYTLTIYSVPKNNGVILDGLCIHLPDSALSPTLYLKSYYEQACLGMSMDEITEDIVRLFRNYPPPSGISPDCFADFEKIRDKIMMKLIHAGSNRQQLEDLPHILYLDLAIVFYLSLELNESGQMTSLIHKEHAAHWNMDARSLFSLALVNTPRSYPAEIRSMEEVMKEIARKNLGDAYNEEIIDRLLNTEEHLSPLYVLSNQTGIYGASCILYDKLIKDFADTLREDLVIIPSSIHEVLLTPDNGEIDYEELNSMVVSVNQSDVPPEDQLSDHIYLYSRSRDQISLLFSAASGRPS